MSSEIWQTLNGCGLGEREINTVAQFSLNYQQLVALIGVSELPTTSDTDKWVQFLHCFPFWSPNVMI